MALHEGVGNNIGFSEVGATTDWTGLGYHGNRSGGLNVKTDGVLDNASLSKSFTSASTDRYINLMEEDPPKYLSNYKNPCWKEILEEDQHASEHHIKEDKRSQLRCLPYFYVAGVHKAGTTDLIDRLAHHPLVTWGGREAHWWSRARSGKPVIRTGFLGNSTIRQYVDFFDKAAEEIQAYTEKYAEPEKVYNPMILGEKSPEYLWYASNWQNLPEQQNSPTPRYLPGDYIHHMTPQARIIVSLRNPTAREYSMYKFMYEETLKSKDLFSEAVAKGVPIMKGCLKSNSPYYCATNDDIIKQIRPLTLHIGMYATFLERWMKIYPWGQIYILRLEDYRERRPFYVNDIFKFLGVGPLKEDEVEGQADIRNHNAAKEASWGPMLNETKKLLDHFFRPFNQQLVELLGDSRFAWQD